MIKITNPVLENIWKDRYQKNGETFKQNLERVAKYITNTDNEYNELLEIMKKGLFFPAGRTMSNSGIGRDLTLNNCFTAPMIEDNLTDIFDKVALGAKTHQKGGGIGYSFSKIRPKGMPTSNDAIASGPVSFMDVFNAQTATILQGGRRGANMGILSVYHPDIEEFINAKSYDAGKLVHFNVSVIVDNDFMNAVHKDENIFLHYPVVDNEGKVIKDQSKWKIKKEVKARDIWDKIMQKAYDNGEPGIFFDENLNDDNPLNYIERIVTTNPCAEYLAGTIKGKHELHGKTLEPKDFGGACNLGSIFIHRLIKYPFTKKARIDVTDLKHVVNVAVRTLDNIIDINKFPDKIYENYQKAFRTIGLGITGLGDALVMMGITYGSKDAIEFTGNLMNLITLLAYETSIQLAKEKGSFPLLNAEEFAECRFINKHIEDGYTKWNTIKEDIKKYGIRNGKLISIAPTGTLSLTYGENCSSGLEPIFSLSYDRKVKMGGQSDDDIKIVKMEDYAYKEWLKVKDNKFNVVDESKFVTAMNLTVEDHLEMLAAIAYHVDMSCSKTINVPTDYPFEKCKQIYEIAWKKGIKGCTIFRPNEIRSGVLISETKKDETKEVKTEDLKRGEWKPLADDTIYIKKPLNIGCGKLKLFVGFSLSEKKIQDLYVKRSSLGGCTHNIEAVAIALSAIYRLGGSTKNIEKAFSGTGGCNSFLKARLTGKEISMGSSCATAILNILKEIENEQGLEPISNLIKEDIVNANKIEIKKSGLSDEDKKYIAENGEIAFISKEKRCPLCGAKVNNSDGCLTCKECGYSKC